MLLATRGKARRVPFFVLFFAVMLSHTVWAVESVFDWFGLGCFLPLIFFVHQVF